MSGKKHTIMSGAQKAKVALEAVKGNKSVNDIAQEFGVHHTRKSAFKRRRYWNMAAVVQNVTYQQGDPYRLY